MRTSRLFSLLAVAVSAGILAFALLLFGADPPRGWRIFLVNFVFCSGVAIAAVAWSAIFQLANARWPAVVRRMAASCAAFLPVAFLLFVATWFGRQTLFSSAHSGGLYLRETIALLLLFGLGLLFARRPTQRLAVVLLIVYVAAQTVFAWDFLMWLEPEWTSTLFGAFYIVSSLYAALAILTALTLCAPVPGDGKDGGGAAETVVLYNLGRLLFAFSLLWVYFFWSQYLVIWYGNLPREIGYVIVRSQRPWSVLAILVLLLNFLLPFLLLLPRAAKRSRTMLLLVASLVVMGVWLQQYLLAMPSLALNATVQFGWQEALVSVGFLAIFVLTCQWGLKRA